MEVEEERVKGQVMDVEEEKIGTDAGEVCEPGPHRPAHLR